MTALHKETEEEKLMKRLQTVVFTAAGLFLASQGARAGEIKVIANDSVVAEDISTDELKGIFLATKTSLGASGHVEPVLEKGGAAHEMFIKTYLAKTDANLTTYYRSLVFTGKGSMPKAFATDAEVLAYVAKTKGAIGYVSGDADASGVKTLTVK